MRGPDVAPPGGSGCRLPAHSSRGDPAALTVLELLIVVAVLLLLAALILPVFSRAPDKGRQTTCSSRLAQLAKAEMMYAEDNDSYLPPYWNRWQHPPPVPANAGPPRPDLLYAALTTYNTEKAAWFCPNDPYARRGEEVWGVTHEYSSYAFSHKPWPLLTLAGDQTPLLGPSPARQALATPAGYRLIMDPNGKPDGSDRCPTEGANHFGGVNIAYLDGHVKWENRCRY